MIVAIAATGYKNATERPVLRLLTAHVSEYPAGKRPIRIAFFSDLHVHGPDMPPGRVARIVDEINALHPDIDIAAGDFVGDNWIGAHYSASEAIAPLRHLKARYGVYAVLGNNDYDVGATDVVRALESAGVRVLMNEAIRSGPLALGGIDGRLYARRAEWKARRDRTFTSLERTTGIKILVVHRPDDFASAPPFISLILAGHTHCGQIVLPLIGPLLTGSDFGRRYVCGVVRDGTRTMIVTGGLGTSHVPIRIGAPPDIWLISITGRAPH